MGFGLFLRVVPLSVLDQKAPQDAAPLSVR